MRLTQRQIHHGVFGLLTIGGLLLLINSLAIGLNTVSTVAILIGTLLAGGLWIAYWQGWEHARLAVVILVTLLISLGIQDVSRNYDIIIFIAPVIALILAQPGWIVASAVTILGSLLFRANGAGVYADTSNLLEFAVIIAGLMFSRLATDNTKRLAEVHAQVEHALRQAEHQGSQHCISPDSPCLRLASWREYGMIAPAAIVCWCSAATILTGVGPCLCVVG